MVHVHHGARMASQGRMAGRRVLLFPIYEAFLLTRVLQDPTAPTSTQLHGTAWRAGCERFAFDAAAGRRAAACSPQQTTSAVSKFVRGFFARVVWHL